MATDLRARLRRWGAVAVAGLVLGGAAVAAGPATAPARAAVTDDVRFTGHGWGHGRGMGQWGAYGYATQQGWLHPQILSHFYGGTVQSTQPNTVITVSLTGQDGRDLLVTSGRDFTAGGVRVSAGSAARLTANPDGSFTLATSHGCGSPVVWTTSVPNARVTPTVEPGNDLQAMLSLCTAAGTTQYRGELSVLWAANAQRTVNTVWMEDYLRGVVPRESPASWGDGGGGKGIEALKAQAVAARSYAYAENRSAHAKTCDTTSCQVYMGAGKNLAALEYRQTDTAIAATAGVVLRNGVGGIVRAEFSSSTGGWSAGGAFPPVRDDGDVVSPHHDWSYAVPATKIADAFGVGTLTGIRVTARNGLGADGGRVTQVEVAGTAKTVTATGAQVRTRLGLKSDWFVIGGAAVPDGGGGGGTPGGGVPTLFQAATNAAGAPVQALPFGSPGDVPLSCDWDGDGVDTAGVFRGGTFFLASRPGTGQADRVFGFGQAGDQPVCGDWDGDDRDTVGVYRDGVVYLRNSTTTGVADGRYFFGSPGDTLVAGDWNGDGFDTVGVWRSGAFFLTQSNVRPATDVVLPYGDRGDLPAVGDWDGNRSDTVGVFRAGRFLLRNSNTAGAAQLTVGLGDPGDRPVVGRRAAAGGTVVGVARGY
ncbi:SpoIID/LytB domain-containing protein [Geodermatophilus sp. DSM 44513]|uniref:SpoIID/LytB domain-containing protein n=1 Tax=Geodermatophilus sp. DSM 44513 TaxID=1528104 RepID=UPI00127E8FD2|nr:SpoIID/LytB domain-containing protein [Geodermatophilus sp. DSM 44513]WNV74789.1 SpoIID/LytB domain-containing protein [Geodermatophilus sp. DSM 44513]